MLTILSGLPASGKSTYAREHLDKNTVRVNKDKIREMLTFGEFNPRLEKLVLKLEMQIAHTAIEAGKHVIVDDTNLNVHVRNTWLMEFPSIASIVTMDTPYMTCVQRDAMRHGRERVGFDVITNMARRYRAGGYEFDKQEVIYDLDGTLADCEHRQHLLPDWNAFFEAIPKDSVRKDIRGMLKMEFHAGKRIVIVTGRPERTKQDTLLWLTKNGIMPFIETIIFRKEGDKRPDDMVKRDILNTYFDKKMVERVVDDRPSVIRMWREEGLLVEDVGKGIEF